MGNWLGRSNSMVVKQLEKDGMTSREEDKRRRRSFDAASSPTRIQVRMTKRQLEKLKARAGESKGDSELGRLIVKECMEGRLSPRVVDGEDHVSENSRLCWSLSTIDEEVAGNESL